MSYLQRWRRNNAAAVALADGSSDENEIHDAEQVVENNVQGTLSFSDHDRLSFYESETDLSDFGFLDTVETSDSESEDQGIDESDKTDGSSFREQLALWATSNSLSKSCVDDLLKIIKPQCNIDLPKDCRTLLKTPRSIEYFEKCGGKYIYFGIKPGILKILSHKLFEVDSEQSNTFKLNFNIDGIPLFKSTGTQFWPILCSSGNFTPFMVSIFYGPSKPNSLHDFLYDFLKELGELINEGIPYGTKIFSVEIKAFICDAPARAFLKATKSHSGYDSCERCTIHGYYKDNRVVLFTEEMCTPRTDDDFKARRYPTHQTGITPLTAFDIKCVSSFCLDYMHMVCLGVMKRIFWFWRQGPAECKLSALQLSQISNTLVSLSGKIPSEFARQPRTLCELERWKATEFRQFLLYTGPIIMKKFLSKEVYQHFLALTVGISILLESDYDTRTSYLNYASELLVYFVKKSKDIYSEKFIVYNVHSLIHLADDCRNFKCSLNEISAFPYENHLRSVKKLVKNAKNPIVQVAKRIQERDSTDIIGVKQQSTFQVISTKERNSCFLLKDGSYAYVKDFKNNKNTLICQVLKQRQTENFFIQPCESKLLNIVYVRHHQRMKRKNVHVSELYKKLVCIPYERGHVLVPMLHTLDQW